MIEDIIALRRELHTYPELSGQEKKTSLRILKFVNAIFPGKEIMNLGGTGLAIEYDFGQDGPVVMIRCELDALPINEKNEVPYKSINAGVSHKCGHDGHMAMVAGLVYWIKEQSFKYGKIVLLFQPAEETGKGAHEMLHDKRFQGVKPDFIFALHNLPGEEKHTILIKDGSFSASVQSMIVHLKGKTSHASEPENGINPALAMSEIITSFSGLSNHHKVESEDFSIITPIHFNLGDKSYGISPSEAEMHFTVRTWTEKKMDILKSRLIELIDGISSKHTLQSMIEWIEYFPTTHNNEECYGIISKAATKNGYAIKKLKTPLKFGEDFGWFSQKYKAGMFGLGSGINHPALHNADYDFPDEILESGMKMFQCIIAEILD